MNEEPRPPRPQLLDALVCRCSSVPRVLIQVISKSEHKGAMLILLAYRLLFAETDQGRLAVLLYSQDRQFSKGHASRGATVCFDDITEVPVGL